jgi:hypothetical protein
MTDDMANGDLAIWEGEVSSDIINYNSIDRSIVIDLMSLFVLQLLRWDRYRILDYMRGDPVGGCYKLVDVLVRCGVCDDEKEGRIIVVPALIREGLLYHWPDGHVVTFQSDVSERSMG